MFASIAINRNKATETTPLIEMVTFPVGPLSKVQNLTDPKSDSSYNLERIFYYTGIGIGFFRKIILGITPSLPSNIRDSIEEKLSYPDKDVNGETILHRAVRNKSYISAAFILGFLNDSRFEPNRDGNTAVMLAHKNKDEKMLGLCLRTLGINLSKIDAPIPIHYVRDDPKEGLKESWGIGNSFDYILENASDPEEDYFYTELAQILIERGAKYDPKLALELLQFAFDAEDTKLANFLIDQFANKRPKLMRRFRTFGEKYMVKLFKNAIGKKDVQLVEKLIEHNLKPNEKTIDETLEQIKKSDDPKDKQIVSIIENMKHSA